ncbi:plectin-like protein [Trypanosoma rangeli]|uniref:Plectin-like protein n=1 Tax=Trypanosoma rangeli TaxID=5698 RepID=A0A3S5IS55_TRYRA|nr:plectin-like protein [Trypanosoma rangeli]RNF09971.1 plectin-like protein [Trypanosoma rangeli]|eukprot:RNF09971.1 plectin-like protein [Trypanosoma rangeli]
MSTASQEEDVLVNAPERPQTDAIEDARDTVKHGEEGGGSSSTFCNGPTPPHLEEAMCMTAEALAAAEAQREKLHLHQVRQSVLEQEVAALRSGLKNLVQGPGQHTSQQAYEVEMKLRTVEAAAQGHCAAGTEGELRPPEESSEVLYRSISSCDSLLQLLQERVTRLESRQKVMEGHADKEFNEKMEKHMKSIAETHVRRVLREEQQEGPNNDTVNTATQESTAATGSLDTRSLRVDINELRQDLHSCIVEMEKVMDQQQRLVARLHSCMSTVQRHQTEIVGLSEQQKMSIGFYMERLETQQATAMARQEKQLAAKLELLQEKMVLEVRRMHELEEDVIVRADQQRLSEVTVALDLLRNELRIAVERQRGEMKSALEQISEMERRVERDGVSQMGSEIARQIEAAQQAQDAATNATQRLLQSTQEDLQRMQNGLNDNAVLMQEQSRRLQESLETRLTDEAHRLKAFTSDATLRLQQQVEEEVQRFMHITEQESLASMQQEIHRVNIALRALEEEQWALHGMMLNLSVPSRMIASLDHRMNVLQEDVRSLYAKLENIQSAGSPALSQQLLAKQQRMLQEDLLEVKSRLRRCEKCCSDSEAALRNQEASVSHSFRSSKFPHISVTQPITPKQELLTTSSRKLGQAGDVAAGVTP